jgi:hypothetical protein
VRRKHVLKLIPPFDIKYSIAADLKFQLKLIHELKLKHAYLPSISTRIRIGGYSNSSILSVFEGWKQSYNVVDDVLGRGAFIYTLKKVIKNTTGFFTAKL